MKKFMQLLLIAGIALLASCSKKGTNITPDPDPSTLQAYAMWTVTGVQQTNQPLYALISITDKNGSPVVTNKKLSLDDIQGRYKTDRLLLPKGSFKLTKFIIVRSNDSAVHAVPLAQTEKATQVPRPLPVDVTIDRSGINDQNITVIKVQTTDRAESFGYTNADLGFQDWTQVKVRLTIRVGQVAYDSLPGTLQVDALSQTGEQWTREIALQQGITEVRLPKDFASYRLKVDRWNTTAEKIYSRQELQQGMQVHLEAARSPKRLIEEATFLENAQQWQPDSRAEYLYGADGLSEVRNHQRSLLVSGLPLSHVNRFVYSNGRLDSIKRFDAADVMTGHTAFFYQDGRISNMFQKSYDQQTGAAVTYSNDGQVIRIDYLFSNGQSMVYTRQLRSGNKVSDVALGSNGGSETGVYEYDTNIDPKYDLGYPDLYLTNHSKNNLTMQMKQFAGAVPSVVPYKYEYVYDADGYPSVVYISYKGYTSQQHLYRTKTTYKYQ